MIELDLDKVTSLEECIGLIKLIVMSKTNGYSYGVETTQSNIDKLNLKNLIKDKK